MADTSDFRNGLIIKYKNGLYTITDFQHVKPGKGGAFVRSTLKNLKTGKVLDNTFRAGEGIDIVRVERKKYQYLFREAGGLVLMDNDTYEQITVADELFDGGDKFLKEGEAVELLLDEEDKIVTLEIPIHVQLEVIETEPGFRGNTATNAVKPAKLETGVSINVPLFIDEGDLLKVDTRTGQYMERIKNWESYMDINEIKKLIKVFENANVTELSIQEGDLKIKISKNGTKNSNAVYSQSLPLELPASNIAQPNTPSTTVSPVEKIEEDNSHIINSPIVGTFYRAPAPDADSYVQVGDSVTAGSVLCIVEAMKLMNEIECDISGKVVQILVEDGTPVEFNQPLFKIEKS